MLEILLNGRYRLIRILGSGGFGQTFVAEDTQSENKLQCVVKQLQPISQDTVFLEVARRLFFNEVEMLRRLGNHDRIPALLNNFEEDGQFYLVQELIEGRSLSEELKLYKRLEESEVIALLRDVAEVLEFVHHENVIHRDIKPSNLVRRQQDHRIVLIDFGAVKELNTQVSTQIESTKLTVGIATEGYGPTEQLAGKPRFSSDLYALGMTAIQALTGLHPSQLPTHTMTGEVIWRDRTDVSPWLAEILTKMVRYHFNDRFQSATELLAALSQTAQVQRTNVQPRATWDQETLISSNSLYSSETTLLEQAAPASRVVSQKLGKWAIAPMFVALVSAVTTGCVVGMQYLGWLQPLELAAFDRMTQLSEAPPDPRILVVGITEADIQEQKRFPLSDQVIAKTIQRLQAYKPSAIGLDLFRDIPQEPGRAELLKTLQAPNTIAILNLGSPITPAPPGVPLQRVGFNDVPLDLDSVVRRNLLFADLPDDPDAYYYSFALRLSLVYLTQQGVKLQPHPQNPALAQLGKTTLNPLSPEAGGYQNLDDRGYQIMLQYRGKDAIQQVSLGDVLRGRIQPTQVQNRIVLIGTTAANAKDLFFTPYSPITKDSPRTSGVMIHAQMVSQLVSLALGEKRPIWYWIPSVEVIWIVLWSVLAASVTWRLGNHPMLLLFINGIVCLAVFGIGYALFLQSGWIPIAAPAIAVLLASTGIGLFRRNSEQRTRSTNPVYPRF